jgi:hypothetical protein
METVLVLSVRIHRDYLRGKRTEKLLCTSRCTPAFQLAEDLKPIKAVNETQDPLKPVLTHGQLRSSPERTSFSSHSPNVQLVDRIIKAGGLGGNAKMAPWIVHSMYKWAGKDYVEKEFRAGLPVIIRFLFDHFWWVPAVRANLPAVRPHICDFASCIIE